MSVGRARSDSDALGGVVNGYAPLDSGLHIPSSYIDHELDSVEFTAPVTVSATADPLTTIVTGSSVAYDGSTAIIIEFGAPYIDTPAGMAGDLLILALYDGSTQGRYIARWASATTASERHPVYVRLRLTPSAASHTYSIRGQVTNAARTATVGAGAGTGTTAMPGFIRITRV